MKKTINVPEAPLPIAQYSQAVLAGNTLYVSGQVPVDPKTGKVVDGGAAVQARMALDNIGAILKGAGMNFSNVVKCSIFLSDMALFKEVNEVYSPYFPVDPPAREAFAVKGLPLGVDVEISCIAVG